MAKTLLDGLSPGRREEVEVVVQTLRDLTGSATTVFGPAPARVISELAMLSLTTLARALTAEERVERLEAHFAEVMGEYVDILASIDARVSRVEDDPHWPQVARAN